jgi:hypothetical protein
MQCCLAIAALNAQKPPNIDDDDVLHAPGKALSW